MKLINLYSKAIIATCLLLILISCKKESPPQVLSPKGFWTLNSVIVNGAEELNKVYELASVNFMTSCSTEVELHTTITFYSATLNLKENYFIYSSWKSLVNPNADYAYTTCLSQHFTDNSLDADNGDCKMDDKFIEISYVYHVSPGGGELWSTHTYEILELTDNTLKLSGPYPLTSMVMGNMGLFSFSK